MIFPEVKPVAGAAHYYAAMAAMGWAVVMYGNDETGPFRQIVEAGIKSPERALNRATSWQKKENAAVTKASKSASK